MLPVTIDDTSLILVHGSVVDQEVDAIVNAANKTMRGGGGIDGVIHRAAGEMMLRELQEVAPSGARTGQVVVTHGHDLPQPFVFHVAGPRWQDGRHQEPLLLEECYNNCLAEADQRELTSIAFCSISTGIYGFPIDRASSIAVESVIAYLRDHPETKLDRVVFAMYGVEEYKQFETALTSPADGTSGR